MDFIPEKSEIQLENIKIDPVLKSMIKDLNIRKLIPAMQQREKQPRNARQQWALLSPAISRGPT